jgi:hypothetical protein
VFLETENRYQQSLIASRDKHIKKISDHSYRVIDVAGKIADSLQQTEKSLHISKQVIEELLSRAVPFIDDSSDLESLTEFRETMRVYYTEWRKIHPYGVPDA